jgi:hypothetical protein
MDEEEGRRRGLLAPEPTPEVPEDERVEPWAWRGGLITPGHIRRRLRLYREFLERLAEREQEGGGDRGEPE